MQKLIAEKPLESPAGSDPVLRLMARLGEEGFTTEQGPEWWDEYGETIYRRDERLPLTAGETIFIFTRVPDVNERLLRQTSDSVVHTYGARNIAGKALTGYAGGNDFGFSAIVGKVVEDSAYVIAASHVLAPVTAEILAIEVMQALYGDVAVLPEAP